MLASPVFFAFLVTSIAITLVSLILSKFKVPTVVGFVLTGVIIGPTGLNLVGSLPAAQMISELGILFLMFALGLEISIAQLKKLLRPLMSLGFVQVLLTTAVSLLFFHYALGFSLKKSFIFGASLALSSTAIILKLLQKSRESETPHGRVNITILLFQDIIVLPLMIAVPLIAANSIDIPDADSIGLVVFKISAFLIACVLAGYYLIPKIFAWVVRINSREVFFMLILAITFTIIFLAEHSGLSMSIGAFLAGVLISESPYNKQALAELSPLGDVFLGFFFASVGMMINLQFVHEHLEVFLWLIPSLFFIKFFIIYLVVRWNSHAHGISLSAALALSQIGEFSFILGTSALHYKILNENDFQFFISSSVIMLIMTPFLFNLSLRAAAHSTWKEFFLDIKYLFKIKNIQLASSSNEQKKDLDQQENFLSQAGFKSNKVIVIGLGHAGLSVLKELNAHNIPCVGLDFNIEHIKRAKALGAEAQYGDATRPEVLESIGLKDAYMAVITVSGKHLTSKVLAMIHLLGPRVKAVVRAHYLLEVEDLAAYPEDEIVISEAETTHALVKKILSYYI